MCFTNDCEWLAEINSVKEEIAGKRLRCYECSGNIESGELYSRIEQQENELCQRCEDEHSEDYEETHDCQGEHDYGQAFECDICATCNKLLKAIEAVETDAGCPEHSRQPAYGELQDAISYDPRYSTRAISMFPELQSVKWLIKV